MSSSYEVHEVIVTPRPVAGVRAEVPRGRVAQEFGRYLDQVYAAGRAGAVALDGQNIFIYRSATADQLTVDFCVGVTAPFLAVGAVVVPGLGCSRAVRWGVWGWGRLGPRRSKLSPARPLFAWFVLVRTR